MKEKFMRIFSPISLTVIAILDIAVLSYGIFAIKKLIQYPHPRVIFFAAAEVFALIIAVVVALILIAVLALICAVIIVR